MAPTSGSIAVAGTQNLVATAHRSTGTNIVTTSTTWTSSAPSKATVNPTTGVVTGVAAGSAVITGTYGGQSATSTITVTA